jgi:hypothetical protein
MFLHSLLVQKMAKNTHQSRYIHALARVTARVCANCDGSGSIVATDRALSGGASRKDGGARSGLSSKKSPWYQRAVEVLLLIWKQPASSTTTTKSAAAASGQGKLRKSSSLNVAASLTRVCLCAPISSYNTESLYGFPAGADAVPRRSYSCPRASSASGCGVSPLVAPAEHQQVRRPPSGRAGGEGARRVFRGKSLTDDILMRRFVVDEEATRRRNEMEVIRRRHAAASKRRRLGPSPLRRMALAGSEAEEEAAARMMETDKPVVDAVVA